jgi:hypothetical protein
MINLAFFITIFEFAIAFLFVFIFQITISMNYRADEEGKYILPILIEIFAVCSYLMMFNAIAYYTKIRFEVVNVILGIKFNFIKDNKTIAKWNQKDFLASQSPTAVLKVLSAIHIQLNEIMKSMNQIFSLPIALFIGYNLFGSTFSLYETYDLVMLPNDSLRHAGYNIAISLINLHYFIYIFLVIVMSVNVTDCRNETYNILMRILHAKIDEKLKMKIRIFIMQIRHSRAEFSCGLFNFDWMVLYSVSQIFEHLEKFPTLLNIFTNNQCAVAPG